MNPIHICGVASTLLLLVSQPGLSSDGLATWNYRTSGTTNALNAVTHWNGSFYAAGDAGTMLSSSNGIDWVSREPATPYSLTALTAGPNLILAVGQTKLCTSINGVTWISRVAPRDMLYGVAYGNGLYVAVGAAGTIMTSPDAVNWRSQNSGTTKDLLAVACGQGTFIVVGSYFAPILASTNGSDWVACTSIGLLRSVAYSGTQFVAVGGSSPTAGGGTILTSWDGYTWLARNAGASRDNFSGVAFGNGAFVAVGDTKGNFTASSPLHVHTSFDGAAWSRRFAAGTNQLNAVTYGNGSFVAVGTGGLILQSAPVFTLAGAAASPEETFRLTLRGEAGRAYRVETSIDLTSTNWDLLCTITNATEATELVDPRAMERPARFYRAVLP